ncbi:MAG TPA: ChaN family lipoprotein [Syntrophorhabdales bacterium]|nr:ChaN family lipoprotein [Syntrophorhabdales bacterium]
MPELRVHTFIFLISLVLGASGVLKAANQESVDYFLKVSIDVHSSTIKGVASIRLKQGDTLLVETGSLRVRDLRLGGKQLNLPGHKERLSVAASRPGLLRIEYEAVFKPRIPSTPTRDLEYTSVIGEQGVSLTGTWYPRIDRLCRYHLSARLPQGFEAVSEADVIRKSREAGKTVFTFQFPYPLDQITLVGSDRYKVTKERHGRIDVFAYFFAAESDLVPTYMEQTRRYLQLYEGMLGPYPYKRFSVVENILPTGFSMPTFTLLGQDVVRLPFIPATSLGHEVLHQWFGNLVYVDYAKGNWAEGLTTYLADHLFEEQKNAGASYRKDLLIDYQSYVNKGNEFPLAEFRGRTDYASKAIGYGKAAMLFHMLKRRLGNNVFLSSLRYFVATHCHRQASWDDLRNSFEKESGKDLREYFEEWVHEKGLPDLTPEDTEAGGREGGWETRGTLVQWERPYSIDVPVTLISSEGSSAKTLSVEKRRTGFVMSSATFPDSLSMDPEYDLARKLGRREFPPVIARLLGSDKTIIVPSPTGSAIYADVVDAFLQRGALLAGSSSLTDAAMTDATLLLLGADNPVALGLFGPIKQEGGFSISVKENPLNPARVIAVLCADSKEEVTLAFNRIFHYGRYSRLAFQQGRNIARSVEATESGIRRDVVVIPQLDHATREALEQVIRHAAQKKIVYVGEAHDHFADHLVELEIIKGMHRSGPPVAIGMEMFPKSAQPALDDYVAGRIDERQFLKQSRYFTGWGFDYKLYRPILNYARAQGIPVVALNAEKELVRKIYRAGLNSLSPEEKSKLPASLDFSDRSYEEKLKSVFKEHEGWEKERFEFFYQAQVLWDETMAESIVAFLEAHPAYKMVVLAGSGHVANGSGIPRRVARRLASPSAIVLIASDVEKGAADYVVSPKAVAFEPAPKLMVFLKEESGKVIIQSFPADSISEKAGMKPGDVILAIDRVPVRSTDDAKIELLSHKKGDKVIISVLRHEPSGEEREIPLDLIL